MAFASGVIADICGVTLSVREAAIQVLMVLTKALCSEKLSNLFGVTLPLRGPAETGTRAVQSRCQPCGDSPDEMCDSH